jgi:hypothetical protein
MAQLWRLLIPSQQQSALLTLYTPEVLAHLAASLSSKQWRDREAACVALEAFLPTKTWSRVRATLMLLWTSGMRVLDDVRDSTRKAAVGFMKVLSNHVCIILSQSKCNEMRFTASNRTCCIASHFSSWCVIMCACHAFCHSLQIVGACNPDLQQTLVLRRGASEGGGSADSSGGGVQQQSVVEDATGFIVPLLLDKGLLEPSPEGRGFSLGLLLRVVKVGTPATHSPTSCRTTQQAMPDRLKYYHCYPNARRPLARRCRSTCHGWCRRWWRP